MILQQLSRTELTWAYDAFDAIFPPHPSGVPGIAAMNVEGYVTHTFARIPLEPAIGVRIAIWIVALAPIFVLGRVRTIHGLSKEDRGRVVAKLAVSRIYAVRQLVVALKAVAALLYAADPAVRAHVSQPTRAPAPIALARKPASPSKTPSVPPPTSGGRRVAVA